MSVKEPVDWTRPTLFCCRLTCLQPPLGCHSTLPNPCLSLSSHCGAVILALPAYGSWRWGGGAKYNDNKNTWLPLCIQEIPQSRQSAQLFLQQSELWLPQPLTRRRVCPPPLLWFRGEGHTRWRERGWESPNSDEGTYTVVLYIYASICTVLCGIYWRLKPYRLVPLHSAFLGAVGSSRTAAALHFPLELRASRGRGSRPSPTLCSLTVGLQVEQVSVKSVTKCRLLILFYSCLVSEVAFESFPKLSVWDFKW